MKICLILLCSGLSLFGRAEFISSFLKITKSDTSKPFLKEINQSAYEDVFNFEKQLNLESLAQGFDGFQIRIWEGAMASISLTIIINEDSKWQANYYDLQIAPSFSTDFHFKIVNKKMKPVFPRSGWPEFTQKILRSNIMSCPDDSKLSDYSIIVDGTYYFIEIATKQQYRLYTSSRPFPRQKISDERKNLIDILDYIRIELAAYFLE